LLHLTQLGEAVGRLIRLRAGAPLPGRRGEWSDQGNAALWAHPRSAPWAHPKGL